MGAGVSECLAFLFFWRGHIRSGDGFERESRVRYSTARALHDDIERSRAKKNVTQAVLNSLGKQEANMDLAM